MPGPVALVGSGEYLPVMRPIDEALLEGRSSKVILLPTAAGQEGDDRVSYWLELGVAHFLEMGMDPVPLRVLTREDAELPDVVAEVAGAGLIYLSGGSPAYLSTTLRDTPLWKAITDAHATGAALAGCSAGACALTAISGGFRNPGQPAEPGLSVIPHLAVIPHFDRFDARSPGLVGTLLERTGPDLTLVGIDEETALVGGPEHFEVMGRQAAWWLSPDEERTRYGAGTKLRLSPGGTPEVL